MKKKYIVWVIIMSFLLGKYYPYIIIFLERQVNTVQVCNHTAYTITSMAINGYRFPSPSVWFNYIKRWECSEFKKSYWLDSGTTISLNIWYQGELYEFKKKPMDPHGIKKLSLWSHTLHIDNLWLEWQTWKVVRQPIRWLQSSWDDEKSKY